MKLFTAFFRALSDGKFKVTDKTHRTDRVTHKRLWITVMQG